MNDIQRVIVKQSGTTVTRIKDKAKLLYDTPDSVGQMIFPGEGNKIKEKESTQRFQRFCSLAKGAFTDPIKKQWYAEKTKVELVDGESMSSELRETCSVLPFYLSAHSKMIINNSTIQLTMVPELSLFYIHHILKKTEQGNIKIHTLRLWIASGPSIQMIVLLHSVSAGGWHIKFIILLSLYTYEHSQNKRFKNI